MFTGKAGDNARLNTIGERADHDKQSERQAYPRCQAPRAEGSLVVKVMIMHTLLENEGDLPLLQIAYPACSGHFHSA